MVSKVNTNRSLSGKKMGPFKENITFDVFYVNAKCLLMSIDVLFNPTTVSVTRRGSMSQWDTEAVRWESGGFLLDCQFPKSCEKKNTLLKASWHFFFFWIFSFGYLLPVFLPDLRFD